MRKTFCRNGFSRKILVKNLTKRFVFCFYFNIDKKQTSNSKLVTFDIVIIQISKYIITNNINDFTCIGIHISGVR